MEQQTKDYSSDITLYDLWKIIMKRKKFIIGLFLVSVTATAVVSFLLPKVFRGEAVLRIPTFESAISNITVKELTDSIGKIDPDKKIAIFPKTHAVLTDIQLDVLKDSKDKIQVIVEATDVGAMPQAIMELVEYISAINFLKLAVKDEQEKLLKRSNELSSAIAESDNFLNTYGKLLSAGKLNIVGFNPAELNGKIVNLKLDKLTTDQMLQRLKEGVDIAKQLYVSSKPIKPQKRKNIELAAILSILFGVILSFFLEFIEKMRKNAKDESSR